jgi:gamma-glutamylcyclotransferase (GGCT)/AIG2-like uncharacterized protein YtfP
MDRTRIINPSACIDYDIDDDDDDELAEESSFPRPVFLYGTLMSSHILADLLMGDERQATTIEQRRKPAVLHGYRRYAVVGTADFPSIIKGEETDRVRGFLFYPMIYEAKKIANFESDSNCPEAVEVDLGGSIVKAYAYVWHDDREDL